MAKVESFTKYNEYAMASNYDMVIRWQKLMIFLNSNQSKMSTYGVSASNSAGFDPIYCY